jgi:membrane protein required for colicin V production
MDYSITHLIWVDYVIIGLIALSAIIGLFRGFVKEAFSLATWLVSIWLALHFSQPFSFFFIDYIDVPSVRIAAAFVSLLITSLILGAMLSFLMSQLIEKKGMTGTERFIGFIFGVASCMAVVAVLVLLAGLTPLPQDPWWNASVLIGPFQELSIWLRTQIPVGISEYFSY